MNLIRIWFLAVSLIGTNSALYSHNTQSDLPFLDKSGIISNYRIDKISEKNMKIIAEHFEIYEKIDSDSYKVYVPRKHLKVFFKYAPKAILLEKDIHEWTRNKELLKAYRKFPEVQKFAKDLAEKYPDIVSYKEFAKTKEGRPQFYVKVSDNVNLDESSEEPVLFIDAATHGDELITTEVLLHHLEELVSKAGTDDRFKNIVQKTEIYFMPVVSPDSFVKVNRHVHGVDPNRAFPGPKSDPKGTVQCIDNMIEIYAKLKPVSVLNWHGATNPGMILHPWGWPNSSDKEAAQPDKPHREIYAKLGKTLADVTQPRYQAGPITTVIYQAKNTSTDFVYMSKNRDNYLADNYRALGITIEVGSGNKRPTDIQKYVKQTREMAFKYMEFFVENEIPDGDL